MRRASQWLQYEGLRYAVEATLRRGAGVSRGSSTSRSRTPGARAPIDYHGDAEARLLRRRARVLRRSERAVRDERRGAGSREARARVTGAARFVDLDGRVVAGVRRRRDRRAARRVRPRRVPSRPRGRNRYVMTRTDNLAPLLSLPSASARGDGRPANVGAFAALAVVGRAEDVLDLLPGEGAQAGALREEGGMARSSALAPDGSRRWTASIVRRSWTVAYRGSRAR